MSGANAFRPLSEDEITAAGTRSPIPLRTWEPMIPLPRSLEEIRRCCIGSPPPHPPGGAPYRLTAIWPYYTSSGALAFVVARFDAADGRKDYRPVTYGIGDKGSSQPRFHYRAMPGNRPLYRLAGILRAPADRKVLVVAGEKAADVAQDIFGATEFAVTTNANGEKATAATDWTPLEGRHVVIWPDTDEAGRRYAVDVARIAQDVGAASVSIVDVPDTWKNHKGKGWDLADPLPDGVRKADLHRMIETASKVPREASAENALSFGSFEMDPATGLWLKGKEDNRTWVCAPFQVLGKARSPEGSGWGKLLQWDDADGRQHQHIVTERSLHADVAVLAGDLAELGLTIGASAKCRGNLVEYLNRLQTPDRVTIATRTGWHHIGGHRVFVLADEVIGQAGHERVQLASTSRSAANYSCAGTLSEWRDGIGRLVDGHARPTFAVSLAFVGPLLALVGQENCGFNLYGESSRGKSTCAEAAASVWGKGAVGGFVQSGKATDNSLEATAAAHTDAFLTLDEIGQMDSRFAGSVAYMLANGRGKGRSRPDGSAREPATWRCAVLYTGEVTMTTKIAEGGNKPMAGQAIRVLDISQDAGQGFGVFDHPGETGDAKDLSNALKRAAITSYGTAGPEFVRRILASDPDKIAREVRSGVDEFVSDVLKGKGDGQVKRAAQMFAMVGLAGELAQMWGIVPWQPQSALKAAKALLTVWIKGRGGIEGAERMEAVRQVRRFLETHGDARFDDIHASAIDGKVDRPVINRAGWRRGAGSERVWLIPTETWRCEICAGIDPEATARVLVELGHIDPDERGNRSAKSVRTPMGKIRAYVVNASILDGATADD